MKQQQAFTLKGMSRDIGISKTNGEYAYDIHNMRITAQEGETLLTLVNEKGNKEYIITGDSLNGDIIGYCLVDKYLVLFTHHITDSESNTYQDYIYRLHKTDENTLDSLCLYHGDLQFDSSMSLETLAVAETSNIMKVYWIDGRHQPRFINITAEKSIRDHWLTMKSPFDFITKYNQNTQVTVQKGAYSGRFSAGTVQYACTYFNRYGQQTNLFYLSSVYYVSYENRGAAADNVTVSNSFSISISNIDTDFNYIRLYSISRTTADSTPACKIVQDIRIDKDKQSVTVTDTGMLGTIIAPSEILFAGGNQIVPQCMEQKDNTLFFGNFTVPKQKVLNDIRTALLNNKSGFSYVYGDAISKGNIGTFYQYKNQLDTNSSTITTFKGGETYRLGLVFTDELGEKSNVVWIGDYRNTLYPQDNITSFNPVKGKYIIPASIVNAAVDAGYTKVNGVVVYPVYGDREVICQGILCPTVYNPVNRKNNSPYAQSSWFYRDIHEETWTDGSLLQNSHDYVIGIPKGNTQGQAGKTEVDFNTAMKNETCFQMMEIQGANTVSGRLKSDALSSSNASLQHYMDMVVDWNFVTLNSPDIAFNKEFNQKNQKLGLRIIGIVPLTSCANDIKVETSTSQIAWNEYPQFEVNNEKFVNLNLSTKGNEMLTTRFSWRDVLYRNWNWAKPDDLDDEEPVYKLTETYNWGHMPIYPWQRDTSLNIQPALTSESDGKGDTSYISKLQKKIISNLRTSAVTKYFPADIISKQKYDISTVAYYNGLNALDKCDPDSNDYDFVDKFDYYGEVDTLLSPPTLGYTLLTKVGNTIHTFIGGTSLDEQQAYMCHDGIRMKYKSEPHVAFELRYDEGGCPTILPYVTFGSTDKQRGKQDTTYETPCWSQKAARQTAIAQNSKSVSLNISYEEELNNSKTIDIRVSMVPGTDSSWIDAGYVSSNPEKLAVDGLGDIWANQEAGLANDGWPKCCWINQKFLDTLAAAQNTTVSVNKTTVIFQRISAFEGIAWGDLKDNKGTKWYTENPDSKVDADWHPVLYIVSELRTKSTVDPTQNVNPYCDPDAAYAGESIYVLTPMQSDIYQNTLASNKNAKYTAKQIVELERKDDPDGYGKALTGCAHNVYSGIGYWKYTAKNNAGQDVWTLYRLRDYYDDNDGTHMSLWPTLEYVAGYKPDNDTDDNTSTAKGTENRSIIQRNIQIPADNDICSYADYGFMYLAELYNPNIKASTLFGGQSESALVNNIWNTAGPEVLLSKNTEIPVPFNEGDTYYQRFDSLKTYPYTSEDTNQIVEILSFCCETRINIDGRYDNNRGDTSNLYKDPTNFNLINNAYTQNNNFSTNTYLDYDKEDTLEYNSSVLWTKTKTFANEIDDWTALSQLSTLDMDGDKGSVNAIKSFANTLYAFQDNGVARILYNDRVQVNTSDGAPIELSNSDKVSGKLYLSNTIGCSNRRSIQSGQRGLYFMDTNGKDICLLGENIQSLSKTKGFNSWLYNRDFSRYRTFYDEIAQDVYFIDDTSCLVFSEQLGEFTGFYSYEGTDYMFNLGNELIAVKNNKLWHQFAGDYNQFFDEGYKPFSVTVISNDKLVDKIFTNVEFLADTWKDGKTLVRDTFDTLSLWNEYQTGVSKIKDTFGKDYPASLRRKLRIFRADAPRAKYVYDEDGNAAAPVLSDMTAITEALEKGKEAEGYVLRQSMDRIRNTWTYIKLSMQEDNKNKTVLHNIFADYYA